MTPHRSLTLCVLIVTILSELCLHVQLKPHKFNQLLSFVKPANREARLMHIVGGEVLYTKCEGLLIKGATTVEVGVKTVGDEMKCEVRSIRSMSHRIKFVSDAEDTLLFDGGVLHVVNDLKSYSLTTLTRATALWMRSNRNVGSDSGLKFNRVTVRNKNGQQLPAEQSDKYKMEVVLASKSLGAMFHCYLQQTISTGSYVITPTPGDDRYPLCSVDQGPQTDDNRLSVRLVRKLPLDSKDDTDNVDVDELGLKLVYFKDMAVLNLDECDRDGQSDADHNTGHTADRHPTELSGDVIIHCKAGRYEIREKSRFLYKPSIREG